MKVKLIQPKITSYITLMRACSIWETKKNTQTRSEITFKRYPK